MAQRTSADGLLASSRKCASAGLCPALAAVLALALLSGCGGGSVDEPGTTAAELSPAQQNAAQGAGGAEGGSDTRSPTVAKGPPAASARGDDAGEGQLDRARGKRGPVIVPPSGPAEHGVTAAQRRQATIADIALDSPSVPSAGPEGARALPSAYTCDGDDAWPAISWQGIPADTDELVLFAMNVQPVDGGIFFDWAVAGIPPSLTGLDAPRLPAEAVVGRNGFGTVGYSICPEKGSGETYVFALYALPDPLHTSRGFDPRTLRKQILQVSGNVGLMAVSYVRR